MKELGASEAAETDSVVGRGSDAAGRATRGTKKLTKFPYVVVP